MAYMPDLTFCLAQEPNEWLDITTETADVVELQGLLGVGGAREPDLVRLYLGWEYRTYCDIPRDSILYCQRVSPAGSPLEAMSSRVVVRKGTRLQIQLITDREVQVDFLSGDLTAPASFSAYSARPANATNQAAPIPTYTLGDAVCCNPQTKGCFEAAYDAAYLDLGEHPECTDAHSAERRA